MRACVDCKIEFPTELIQPMCVNGKYHWKCPICALAERNKICGLPENEKFQGEMANELWESAISWLKAKGKMTAVALKQCGSP